MNTMTTPPPVSEERNAAVPSSPNTDARLLELKLWLDGLYNTSANLNFISIGNALCELLESRTTIAALTKEHDRRGTSIKEYMDLCEEYSASVVELTDLLTRVRAERDAAVVERDELRSDALRYRWLRCQHPDKPESIVITHFGYQNEINSVYWADKADRAIDAAMAPSPPSVPHE